MATNVKVISTDLRQATIKVNPGTYLTEVLEQACTKFGLPADKFLLKHKQKQLDLSNTFRSAGLIPGAKLELVIRSKTPSAINIALDLPQREAQLAGTRRVTEKLSSDVTIWKVLRHFESSILKGKGVNITARGEPQISNGGTQGGGQLYYETPVLQIEQRSFSTFIDFQKTMAQLGYNSGSVLIRLSFQKTDKTFTDAMTDISQYFQEEEQATREATEETAEEEPAEASGSADDAPAAEPPQDDVTSSVVDAQVTLQGDSIVTNQGVPDQMDVETTPSDPLQPVSVFAAPSSSTPHAAHTTESDDIYTPGIMHAQLHQQRLKTAGQNRRLLSDQELAEEAAEKQARLDAVREVRVRVRFPDNTQATWVIHPEHTGEFLYNAVRTVMAAQTAKFKLVPAGAKVPIRDDGTKLIAGYSLAGSTVVNLLWDDSVSTETRKQPFLKADASRRAREVEIPEIPQGEEEAAPEPGPSKASADGKPKGEGGAKKGMPKWLKLPGKK
ncbi:UBX domain-containing protein [Apiospora rasikravindrae]|uniref:UBX domain-containing protein n=1 Tax=Apiospora rasikravindrae TaxID=990691 RepID=A0ABR1UDJ4_9PEZI